MYNSGQMKVFKLGLSLVSLLLNGIDSNCHDSFCIIGGERHGAENIKITLRDNQSLSYTNQGY